MVEMGMGKQHRRQLEVVFDKVRTQLLFFFFAEGAAIDDRSFKCGLVPNDVGVYSERIEGELFYFHK